MGGNESTVRARELGLALRRAVQAKGMNNAELAHRLNWSPSKVTNLFKGKRGAIDTDVAQILAICGIAGPNRDRLLRLAKEAHQPGWWQEYEDTLPAELRTLIDHEDSAIAITEYQAQLVPGLLQIGDYTREVMRNHATVQEHEVDERVTARLTRQRVFSRQWPARFRFFIDEYALHRTGPGPDIMCEQLHHLLRMSVRPYIEVRVIPDAVGFHAGTAGPFILMEFSEINPVVHMENATSSLFAERPGTIRAHRAILDDLARVALDEEQSRAWIAHLATELGTSPEGAT